MKNKLISIANSFRRNDNFVKDIFVFKDKDNNLHIAYLRKVKTMFSIHSYTLEGHATGYINVHFHPNNRLFLGEVYTYQDYRGKGVASNLNDILNYALQDYVGWVIRGEYHPIQLSTDRDYNRYVSEEELDKRARAFYKSAGFEVINIEEHAFDVANHPIYTYEDDFELAEGGKTECIVIKEIKKQENLPFTKIDGIYVKNDAVELASQEDEAV